MSSSNYLLTRLFTHNTFSSFLSLDDYSPVYIKAIRRYNIKCDGSLSNSDVISQLYEVIDKHYRYEYFYKNTILNKLLINVHRFRTTTALTEVSINKSKADMIMINGKAVVYEIKTDLDNLDRIETQVCDYYKAFDHVCIVTGEKMLSEILKRFEETPVGIYVLTSKDTLKRVKEPKRYRDRIDSEVVFKILRKEEYESLVLQLYGCLPDVPPVEYYSECKKIICNFPIEKIYPLFLKELKNRNKIEVIDFDKIPLPIRFLSYFHGMNSNELLKLYDFLDKKVILEA